MLVEDGGMTEQEYAFHERVAIIIFDGGMDPAEAEAKARAAIYGETQGSLFTEPKGV